MTTADMKEARVRRWARLADEVVRRLTVEGAQNCRIEPIDPDEERAIRTALRRAAKKAGFPVKIHVAQRVYLFIERADVVGYEDPRGTLTATTDPMWKYTGLRVHQLYTDDPAIKAKGEKYRSIVHVDPRDWRA